MVSGIQVIDGSGRSSETNGSIAALAGAHTAMTMPSGIATTPASAKPSSTRCVDIQMSLSSCPLARLGDRLGDDAPGLGKEDRRDPAALGREIPEREHEQRPTGR